MCKEAGMNIPDTVIDRAHRISNTYCDKRSKNVARVKRSATT